MAKTAVRISKRRPNVTVSAVALVNGGMFTILKQCIESASLLTGIDFTFLVHSKSDLPQHVNIDYVEYPLANRSYKSRLFTEYWRLYQPSKANPPDVWLSLHDSTPRVVAGIQAVYCHNALPYFRPKFKHLWLEPFLVVRTMLYACIYKFRAKKNTYVIAQLPWFATYLGRLMKVDPSRVIAVHPNKVAFANIETASSSTERTSGKPLVCFYPSLPRSYKNFEAAIALTAQVDAHLWLTLSGDENRYARYVKRQAKNENIKFLGHLSHDECLRAMSQSDVVLFPSELESFGLPIFEAINLDKIVILPVKPWTVEIAGTYSKAYFYRTLEEGRTLLKTIAAGNEAHLSAGFAQDKPNVPCLQGFTELLQLLVDKSPARA